MTIAVDWDVKPQNKTKNNFKNIWLIRNNYNVEVEVLVFCMSEQIPVYILDKKFLPFTAKSHHSISMIHSKTCGI